MEYEEEKKNPGLFLELSFGYANLLAPGDQHVEIEQTVDCVGKEEYSSKIQMWTKRRLLEETKRMALELGEKVITITRREF